LVQAVSVFSIRAFPEIQNAPLYVLWQIYFPFGNLFANEIHKHHQIIVFREWLCHYFTTDKNRKLHKILEE